MGGEQGDSLQSFIIRVRFKVRAQENSPAEMSGLLKSLNLGLGYEMEVWMIDLLVCPGGGKKLILDGPCDPEWEKEMF